MHVGAHKIIGTVDRTVDVAFRGKVNDGTGMVTPQQIREKFPVADIAVNKMIARNGSYLSRFPRLPA